MRGYQTLISKGFSKTGLRNNNRTVRNSDLLLTACNVRVTKEGLEGYTPTIADILTNVFKDKDGKDITITYRWPFPQVFFTDVGIFIGALEGLYQVTDFETGYTVLTDLSTGAVTWPWTCAEINMLPAFTSGDVFYYYDDLSESYLVVTYGD